MRIKIDMEVKGAWSRMESGGPTSEGEINDLLKQMLEEPGQYQEDRFQAGVNLMAYAIGLCGDPDRLFKHFNLTTRL